MTAVSGLYTSTMTPEPVFQRFHLPTIQSQEAHSPSMRHKVKQGARQALQEAKMHSLATILMGSGSLALNTIPGLKMPWRMAFLMTPFHIAWMVMVTLGIGFVHGFKGTSRQHLMNQGVPTA